MKATFRSAFCDRFHCEPDKFERFVFWKCIYPHAIPIARLILLVKPRFFEEDFKTISFLGDYSSVTDINNEARQLRGGHANRSSVLRSSLRVRLSGKRLSQLAHSVLH